MSNITTTFWRFLQENTIEIPIIQRDYAQGRAEKVNIRNSFLANLKQALDGTLPNEEKTLKLDFVYGSVENKKLNPLDGQQRLTTLWLLHWYIALRTNQLEKAADFLKNFTYETRITSREFCQQLCKPDNFKDYENGSIVEYITSRTWFYSAWKQDPTIQSMLTMLSGTTGTDKKGEDIIDGLEELFIDTTDFATYWEKLTSDDAPIVFYYLPMQDFGLSDDLYIKMNARGKQLTSFENFKADLIGYIEQQARGNKEWETLLDPQEGLPIKLDTCWMDIFWKNKSSDSRVDEIYFAFLNRFFWNELFIAKKGEQYLLDIGKGEEGGNKENENASYRYLNGVNPSYPGFAAYKYFNKEIPMEFFYKFWTVLDNYATVPECRWDNNFHFIPQYTEDGKVTNLTQPHRVVFFSVCKYFEEGKADEISLKRWMRVVWNLVSGEDEKGREIRSTGAMRTAIEFIAKLDSHNVYESLKQQAVSGTSAFEERCKEEIEKARKILDDGTWEDKIINAENHAFFKGTIRFLFRDKNGNWNWNNFNKKWENAREYFDEGGVKNNYKTILIKSLVIQCTDWDNQLYNKQIFNPNASTWKWILCADEWCAAISNILLSLDISPAQNSEHPVLKILPYLPFETFVQKRPKGRFRWNGRLGFYEPYEQSAITFDWGNFRRNEILSALFKSENEFSCSLQLANIKDHCFFEGWDVDFSYKNHTFRWHHNNYVYLMNREPKNPNGYTYRNQEAENEDDKYCCFKAEGIVEIEKFINQLNGLIEEHEGRCSQCTEQICEQPNEQE